MVASWTRIEELDVALVVTQLICLPQDTSNQLKGKHSTAQRKKMEKQEEAFLTTEPGLSLLNSQRDRMVWHYSVQNSLLCKGEKKKKKRH